MGDKGGGLIRKGTPWAASERDNARSFKHVFLHVGWVGVGAYVDHALALGDVRQEAELQLSVVGHDEGLAGLRDEGLADLVLVLWWVALMMSEMEGEAQAEGRGLWSIPASRTEAMRCNVSTDTHTPHPSW